MRYKKCAVLLVAAGFVLAAMVMPASAGERDETLFKEAKILIFDKQWDAAREKLETLMDDFPRSPFFGQALFWVGKCLQETEGREADALRTFRLYLQREDEAKGLDEEAEFAVIELAFKLFEKGRKSFIGEVEDRLESPNTKVRYFAALQMSYVADKKVARKAVPVLKEILGKETDDRIRDRAKIALLRIDPDEYRDVEDRPAIRAPKVLHIEIRSLIKKDEVFSLAIPWALADLAINAIPDEERDEIRRELRKKGHNLDRILQDLSEFRGKIFEIRTEDSIVKIWIE